MAQQPPPPPLPPPPPPAGMPPGDNLPPPPPPAGPPPPGGYLVPPGYPQPAPGYGGYGAARPANDGMAIAALVLGIISIPGICCYGVVGIAAGVTAVILGRISLGKIRASGGTIGGRGMAQAGWICGLVGAVLGLIWGLIQVAFLVFGMTNGFGAFPFPTPSG